MKIREMADRFGVTTRTLRFYEAIGLLSPTRIGRNRLYAEGDVKAMTAICEGKAAGLQLEEIRAFYDPSARRLNIPVDELARLRADALARIEAAEVSLQKVCDLMETAA